MVEFGCFLRILFQDTPSPLSSHGQTEVRDSFKSGKVRTPSTVAQHALPPPLSQALARLRANLGGLESAAERHLRLKEQQVSLATELALMQDDRARLASELDSAMARAERLAKSAKEVDKRLVSMARSIKKVMGEDKGKESGDPHLPLSDEATAGDHNPTAPDEHAEGH